MILIATMIIITLMGTLMEVISIMMITLPLFMPIVQALGFDVVWFAVIFLINSTVGTKSPPFGLSLFVMKGVAPPDTTMGDIYRASLPFVGLSLIAMVLIIAFPQIALWLPSMMR
jgi:TRAP-type mannitol/chloroaromatic compound transport system permease large subunit